MKMSFELSKSILIYYNKSESEKWGLKLNVKKTKVMHVGKTRRDINISIDGQELEQVNQFKYLGSWKRQDGDFKTRIGQAKKKMADLDPIWKDKYISRAAKIQLVHTLIWPVILYGYESWTLKADDERMIKSWLWRHML